jgi:hypothetical protein
MPMTAIVMGVLLAALGGIGAANASKVGTALIPLYVGVIFIALGAGSIARPSLRKHLMHALAAVALLGVLAAVGAGAARWGNMSPLARTSVGGMGVLCAITVVLCVRSFVAARRARESGPGLESAL